MATNSVNNCDGLPVISQKDDLSLLRRFLVLGSETGPYLPSHLSPPMRKENAPSIEMLISQEKGEDIVSEILKFSNEGMAVNQQAMIFALATCARDKDSKTKTAAYEKAFATVCKSPLDLFTFVDYAQAISKTLTGSGWGKAHRRAIGSWYNGLAPKDLAAAVTRYIQRNKWSHRDILKLAHVKPENDGECYLAI